jgi:hypothetical protein
MVARTASVGAHCRCWQAMLVERKRRGGEQMRRETLRYWSDPGNMYGEPTGEDR